MDQSKFAQDPSGNQVFANQNQTDATDSLGKPLANTQSEAFHSVTNSVYIPTLNMNRNTHYTWEGSREGTVGSYTYSGTYLDYDGRADTTTGYNTGPYVFELNGNNFINNDRYTDSSGNAISFQLDSTSNELNLFRANGAGGTKLLQDGFTDGTNLIQSTGLTRTQKMDTIEEIRITQNSSGTYTINNFSAASYSDNNYTNTLTDKVGVGSGGDYVLFDFDQPVRLVGVHDGTDGYHPTNGFSHASYDDTDAGGQKYYELYVDRSEVFVNDSDTTNDFYTLRINTDADAASDINVKLTGTENQITELFRAEASEGAINGFMYFNSEVLLDQDYFESLKLISNFNSGQLPGVIDGTRERVVINGTDDANIIKADVSTWNGYLNVYAHDGNDNVQITTQSSNGSSGVNTYVDPNTLVIQPHGTSQSIFYNQGTEKGIYVMTGGSDNSELTSSSPSSNGISNKTGDSSGFDTISELIYDTSGHTTANMTFDEIGVSCKWT